MRRVGLLDEQFPIFFNDVDYCWRWRMHGFTWHYLPAWRITHVHGYSTRRLPKLNAELAGSAVRFARKYFTGASVLPIDKVSDFVPQISLTIEVNGRPIRAQLDSGAANSVLAKSAAALVGVTPETPGVVNIGKLVGIGRDAIDVWMAPVESIVIGNEKISDTTILFADLYDTAWPNRHPMLLGVDFLLSHRVLVAHSQRQIYFTYAGGPVFQRIAVPGLPSASGGRSADR